MPREPCDCSLWLDASPLPGQVVLVDLVSVTVHGRIAVLL